MGCGTIGDLDVSGPVTFRHCGGKTEARQPLLTQPGSAPLGSSALN